MENSDFQHLNMELIGQIRHKLEQAVGIAKAVESCAQSGNVEHAIQILMGYEGLAQEARDLFRAALVIKRTFLIEAD
ncbi:MAG TPA: hypothetical protein VGC26_05575 [Afipia sp.]